MSDFAKNVKNLRILAEIHEKSQILPYSASSDVSCYVSHVQQFSSIFDDFEF